MFICVFNFWLYASPLNILFKKRVKNGNKIPAAGKYPFPSKKNSYIFFLPSAEMKTDWTELSDDDGGPGRMSFFVLEKILWRRLRKWILYEYEYVLSYDHDERDDIKMINSYGTERTTDVNVSIMWTCKWVGA